MLSFDDHHRRLAIFLHFGSPNMALLGIVLIFTLSIGIGGIGARLMLEAVFLLMTRSAVPRTTGATVRFKGADFALRASAM